MFQDIDVGNGTSSMFRWPPYGIPNPPEQEVEAFGELEHELLGDRMLVYEWRLEQLLAAGWPEKDAVLMAYSLDVDLHVACSLLQQGCDLATARKILV